MPSVQFLKGMQYPILHACKRVKPSLASTALRYEVQSCIANNLMSRIKLFGAAGVVAGVVAGFASLGLPSRLLPQHFVADHCCSRLLPHHSPDHAGRLVMVNLPPQAFLLANWALLAFLWANWAPLQAWVSQGLDCQDSRARIQQQAVVGQAV